MGLLLLLAIGIYAVSQQGGGATRAPASSPSGAPKTEPPKTEPPKTETTETKPTWATGGAKETPTGETSAPAEPPPATSPSTDLSYTSETSAPVETPSYGVTDLSFVPSSPGSVTSISRTFATEWPGLSALPEPWRSMGLGVVAGADYASVKATIDRGGLRLALPSSGLVCPSGSCPSAPDVLAVLTQIRKYYNQISLSIGTSKTAQAISELDWLYRMLTM